MTFDDAERRLYVAVDGRALASARALWSERTLGELSPQACFWRGLHHACHRESQRCLRSMDAHSRRAP